MKDYPPKFKAGKTMTITYAVFKLKRFGHGDSSLNEDNCVGYGEVVGEEWIYSSNSKLGALGVIDRHQGPADFIIKEIYTTGS